MKGNYVSYRWGKSVGQKKKKKKNMFINIRIGTLYISVNINIIPP